MFCPNCGTSNDDSYKFCTKCGTKLPYTQQPAETSAAEEQQPAIVQPSAKEICYIAKPALPCKGLGITGMILGIVSLFFTLLILAEPDDEAIAVLFYFLLMCGVPSLILSCISFKKGRNAGITNGMSLAGIICSSIALALAVMVLFIVCAAFIAFI